MNATTHSNRFMRTGWSVRLYTCPGPLGRRTALALAKKGPVTMSAASWDMDTTREMITDMIKKRIAG